MDLAAIMVNFASEISVVAWRLLWALGVLIGTAYIGGALLRLSRAHSVQGSPPVTIGEITPVLLVGGLMANLSEFINRTWNTFGSGTVSYGPISYEGAADFGKFADAINAVLTLASIAGGVFFMKGVMLLKKASMEGHSSGGSEDTTWRAITHMIFGSVLVQIPDAIDGFRSTFGLFW